MVWRGAAPDRPKLSWLAFPGGAYFTSRARRTRSARAPSCAARVSRNFVALLNEAFALRVELGGDPGLVHGNIVNLHLLA